MKKAIKIFTLLLLMIIPIGVYAAQASYTSTLYQAPGQLHMGSVRDYSNPNHTIRITVDGYYEETAPKKLVVQIGTKGLFGDFKNQVRKIATLTQYSTISVSMGNVGSGKKVYQFGTHSNAGLSSGGIGTNYAGIKSSYVLMQSVK